MTEAFYADKIENSPFAITCFTFAFVLINWVILRKGVIEGIEKSVKYLMPALFLCLLVMVIRNLTLDNAMEGVRFYLTPDFSKITPKLFLDVLGQVFFALSLGFGVMITLSSHLNQQEDMVKTAVITGIINTLVAVMAGFMIFPSLFSAHSLRIRVPRSSSSRSRSPSRKCSSATSSPWSSSFSSSSRP